MSEKTPKWMEEIGKNLIKKVEVNIGDERKSIMYNTGDEKYMQFHYYKDNCIDIEFINKKEDREIREMWNILTQKKA